LCLLFLLLDGRVVDLAKDQEQRLERKEGDVVYDEHGIIPSERSRQLKRDLDEVMWRPGAVHIERELVVEASSALENRLLETVLLIALDQTCQVHHVSLR